MTIVGWPIEVGSRELDARLVFGLRCCDRGISFASGTKNAVTEAAVATKEFAYIHKSAASKQLDRFLKLSNSGALIYAHDEEGLVTLRKYFKPRFDSACLELTTRYFLHGEAQRQTRHVLEPKFSRFTVVGHPSFDLLRGSLSAFYRAGAGEHQAMFGRYALLAPRPESAIDQIALAARLVEADAIDTAVVKPHPGSRQEALPRLPNGFQVVPQTEPIGPLLLGSRLLLHHESTTAIAASLVDVAAVDFSSQANEPYWVDQRLFGTPAVELELIGGSAPLPTGRIVCPTETHDVMHSDTEPASDRILDRILRDGAQASGESRLGPRFRPWRPRNSLSSLSEHGRLKAGSITPHDVCVRTEAMATALGVKAPKVRFYGDGLFLMHP